tara:strand:+ start:125 stop:343 length:219 start_codon:yes stop_codon:yes gene_type:complete
MELDTKKNFWDSKPYWCQPWSIIAFGISLLIISWYLFNNIIITSILCSLVIIWWVLFLILVPNSYKLNSDEK